MRRAINIISFIFISFLVNVIGNNALYAQCSTAAAPTYSGSCSEEFFTSIAASGPYVTSTISYSAGSCSGTYIDNYSSQGVSVPIGGTVNMNISRVTGSSYTGYLSVYVDWNNNGTYETSELVGAQYTFNPGAFNTTYSFVVPTTGVVTLTNLHMRVFLAEVIGDAPCIGSYGQAVECYLKVDCTSPTISITPTTASYCAGGTGATITASGAGIGGTYSWLPATGLTASTGAAVIAAPGVTTVYTVIGTTSLGCANTASSTITVYSVTPAIVSIGAVQPSLCAGSNLDVYAVISASTGPYAYSWKGPSGYSGGVGSTFSLTNSAIITAIPSSPAGPVYTVTITDAHNCIVKGTATTMVNPLPDIYPMYGGGPYCANLSGADVQLGGSDAGANYQLYNGSTAIGLVVSGSGGPLDFGNQVTGVYSVLATYPATGCSSDMDGPVTVIENPLPVAITGTMVVCSGLMVTLSDGTTGGAWSSGASTVASINSGTGVVTGGAASTANITYTLPTTCSITTVVTVNPLSSIVGSMFVCVGSLGSLSDANSGGVWSSSAGSIGSVDGLGNVYPGMQGTTTISYQLPTGCTATTVYTVNPLPGAITGTMTVCYGLTTQLTDASTGGTWISGNTMQATIGLTTGLVTGGTSGNAGITYTLPTGCAAYATVTANPLPATISGSDSVCYNGATTLSDLTTGGVWGSLDAGVATVSGIGAITTAGAGTTTITYTLPTGCTTNFILTVDPLPAIITGNAYVCEGLATPLGDASTGGTWASVVGAVGTVGSVSGIVSGLVSGQTSIVYTLPTGCSISQTVTVNAVPAGISGTLSVCVGLTTDLGDITTGGTWSSNNTTIATVGSLTGIAMGQLQGSTTITYKVTSTGCITTAPVTVNPLPGIINGATQVCVNASVTLTDAVTGGAWASSNAAAGTIDAATGILTGIGAGTTVVTYTIGSGCYVTAVETVNAIPTPINGQDYVCKGLATPLTDATSGGIWASGAAAYATVDGSGNVSGVLAGSAAITYTLPVTGCYITTLFTVNPLPSAISGTLTVCPGLTTTLTDASTGGTWASSTPGKAGINSATGVVTGNAAGTATIVYTLPTTCQATAVVTVNPLPPNVTGILYACQGFTSTLADGITGGTWGSGNTAIATVITGTGVVTGVAGGSAAITYTLPVTGCYAVTNFTTNPTPSNISGNLDVCAGSTTLLADIGGGSWELLAPGIASIGSTGLVSGIGAGTATVTYTLPTGCITTAIVTVYPLPSGITGTLMVCPGATTTLIDLTSGGSWSSINTVAGTIDAATGTAYGSASGTTLVSYTLAVTGCAATAILTVNPSPPLITGVTGVCKGLNTTLADAATGGTWSSSAAGTGSVAGTGIVTGVAAGTAIITYTPPTGCVTATTVTVNPLPGAILGSGIVCPAATAQLSDLTGGGTWSSSVITRATIGGTTGIATGALAGTTTITYTVGTGCIITTVLTVDPLPSAILGNTNVCYGLMTSLSDTTGTGAWSSSAAGIAPVTGGIVTGSAYGTATITYTLPTGCTATTTVVVDPPPAPISGTLYVCGGGATTDLTDASTGGTWSSSSTTTAVINMAFGIVTGINAGTTTITYTLPTTCQAMAVVTVNPVPGAITGALNVCPGLTTALSDTTAGGTWSSSNLASATVGTTTGVVMGINAGTSSISYILNSSGCYATTTVTVFAYPPAISGTMQVCAGLSTTLTDAVTGGTWSTTDATVAIGTGGTVTGVSAGTAAITYTNPGGCIITTVVTVNPDASVISGTEAVCAGLGTTLSDSLAGGAWSSTSPPGIISIGSGGLVTGVSAGTANITYTLPTGCRVTAAITVNPLPAGIAGLHSVCVDGITTLAEATTGGGWSMSLLWSGVAIADGLGDVSGIAQGTAVLTYTLPTGCLTTAVITVNPLPVPVSPASGAVCIGATTLFTDLTTGGTWASGSASVIITSSTGIVYGVSAGSAAITYKLPTGCLTTTTILVNPLPGAITGDRSVCIGSTSTLGDTPGGGAWSISTPPVVASVGLTSGVVSGFVLTAATVTYTLPTGCIATATITVNPYPVAITGTATVCQGSSTTLVDSAAGGSWSSANMARAAVNPSGVVSGIAAGGVSIIYTLPTGCAVTTLVTVYPLFAISGSASACAGTPDTLSNGATGGTWTSGYPAVATVGASSGIVTGLLPGNTYITYTLPTGCVAYLLVSVNPAPASYNVTGGGSYCGGGTGVDIGLNGSDTGVTYTLYRGTMALSPVPGTGAALDFGLFIPAGTYTVLAANNATGCTHGMSGDAVIVVTAIAVPFVSITVSPSTTVCAGTPASFSAAAFNGGATPAYQWRVNGFPAGTGPSYSYTPLNGDVVSVVLASDAACAMPDTARASVTMATATGLAPSVSLWVSPGDSVCPGTAVTISATPVNGGFSPIYHWVKNGIPSGSGATYSFMPNNGDNVFCLMYSSSSCTLADSVASVNNITMNVPPIYVPVITIAAYPGTRIVAGETVTLVAGVTFGGQGLSYQWAINGAAVPGATTDTLISNSLSNLDVVGCEVTGSSVCGTATRTGYVTMSDTIGVGVHQVQALGCNLKLVPNPNNGAFTISGQTGSSSDEAATITVTDMLGQEVYKSTVLPHNGMVNAQVHLVNITGGIYICSIKSATVNKVIHFVVGQ